MRTLIRLLPCILVVFFACKSGNEEQKEKLSPEEKVKLDSVSKAEQSKRADSIKKTNPLLIVPPDSVYTGSYVDKYSNGITKFTGYFRFGQRHGQWLSFYPSGLAWSEMHYDKGLRQGPNIAYYESGKIRYTGFYKNDQKDSLWTYYDSSGMVIEKLQLSKDKLVKKLSKN
jgi:antitoxin component YwqK of YwqJK toxin-antitoxin module